MQTFLHGRDLIGDLDFSKEEVETIKNNFDIIKPYMTKRGLDEIDKQGFSVVDKDKDTVTPIIPAIKRVNWFLFKDLTNK